ncbi:MAG TPA: hypothetical protein VJ813_18015 [Vicinamibacterales bacterium]|nr:hypothetical protein [Vicinamibacterales bacterium]
MPEVQVLLDRIDSAVGEPMRVGTRHPGALGHGVVEALDYL